MESQLTQGILSIASTTKALCSGFDNETESFLYYHTKKELRNEHWNLKPKIKGIISGRSLITRPV
jgi:hypothetical protein